MIIMPTKWSDKTSLVGSRCKAILPPLGTKAACQRSPTLTEARINISAGQTTIETTPNVQLNRTASFKMSYLSSSMNSSISPTSTRRIVTGTTLPHFFKCLFYCFLYHVFAKLPTRKTTRLWNYQLPACRFRLLRHVFHRGKRI